MKFFEDIAVGEAAVLGSHQFTAAAIAAFAARFEPWLIRLDDDAPALEERQRSRRFRRATWRFRSRATRSAKIL